MAYKAPPKIFEGDKIRFVYHPDKGIIIARFKGSAVPLLAGPPTIFLEFAEEAEKAAEAWNKNEWREDVTGDSGG